MPPYTLTDLARLAQARLPHGSWDFVAGGAGEERTLRANEVAFDRIQLRPRVLVGADRVDPATTVLGRRWAAPIGVAPTAYHTLMHPEGECATVAAAGGLGLPVVVSTLAGRDWAELRELTPAPLWLQLYCLRDWRATEQLVGRAAELGFEALMLTVDTPRLARRWRDLRNGFRLPAHITPVNLPEALRAGAGSPAAHAGSQFDAALDWSVLDRIRAVSPLPLLVKGVLTGADAGRAAAEGAAAVVVSNHGGRQLDGAPATLDALPEVVEAVAGRCPVLLDGGVRRGADVLAALALGAAAVLVGRPVLYGLAVDGAAGVRRVLDLLREELVEAMALTGRTSPAEVDRDVVRLAAAPPDQPRRRAAAPDETRLRAAAPDETQLQTAAPDEPRLGHDQLHPCVADPVLDTMTFLNEITARYPEAISFGPGRPFEELFDIEDVFGHLRAYLDWLRETGHELPERRRTLLQYGPTAGNIRELVARALARDEQLAVDPRSVVVTVGAQEALLVVLRTLFACPQDVLLVTDPCYVGATGAARLLDIPVVPVPETDHGPDLAALEGRVTALRAAGSRPRACYVVPDLANPSGTTMPEAARRRLLDLAARTGLLVIEDCAYRLLAPLPRIPTLKALDRGGRVIQVGSYAKVAFPGLRVGYVVADQPAPGRAGTTELLADALAKVKSMVSINTSPISQAIVAGLLVRADCRLAEASAAAARHYAANLRCLCEELARHFPPSTREARGVSWNTPAGGFFLTLRVPFAADDEALRRCAERYRVIWTPMRYFYHGGGGETAIRLSISSLTREQVVEGAGRLAAFVADEAGPMSEIAARRTSESTGMTGLVPAQVTHWARRHPQATAVTGAGQRRSYADLVGFAGAVAQRLAGAGVVAEDRVAVLVGRGPDVPAMLLGTAAAGAACVPLDPTHPPARLARILADAQARVVLTDRPTLPAELADQTGLADRAGRAGPAVVRLDELPRQGTAPTHDPHPDALAYVLYTSGSTGTPKGVAVTHGALANCLDATRRNLAFAPGHTLLAVTTLSFDIAMLELLLPPASGGRTAVAGDDDARSGEVLAASIARERPDYLHATPLTWQLLLLAGWAGDPRLVALCGGDLVPPALAGQLAERTRQVWHLYGPTEATMYAVCDRVRPGPQPTVVPIGGPIDRVRVRLLDRALRPVPDGEIGELCLGGAGLARGYLDRRGPTAARFVPDPDGDGARIYRTGDLARRLSDGRLELHGRDDRQVKIRGHRVELGEVEAVLSDHPEVAVAAAVALDPPDGAGRRIVAYLQLAAGNGDAAAARAAIGRVREHTRGRLPRYMLPSTYGVLAALPATSTGKVDRAALTRIRPPGR